LKNEETVKFITDGKKSMTRIESLQRWYPRSVLIILKLLVVLVNVQGEWMLRRVLDFAICPG
jgi:hypothetical protein